jgi:hypothetical protein
MDNRAEISAFLKSRRDKITPEQAGLPVYGNRRVSGLRRSEVASKAAVTLPCPQLDDGSQGPWDPGQLDQPWGGAH